MNVLDHRELAMQIIRAQTEALASTLNAAKATPADFEEDNELGGFTFDGDDGFEITNDWGMIGGAAFERNRWVAWHQEHE